jgi:hypothetical protein
MTGGRTRSVYESKINLLRMVTGEPDSSGTKDPAENSVTTSPRLKTALQAEVLYARTEKKTLDILEICSGETLGKLGMLLSESLNQWVEHLFDSLIHTYEKLKKLGFTYYNDKILVIDTEEDSRT